MTKYMQVQQQYTVEQEMQLMYMYDDFNNVVGIANETQAVLEYFKDDPEHPMVNINLNRLILQANLSNGIHMDQQEEANGELLQGTRKDLKQLYEKVMGNPAQYDERITNILKSYLKNLEAVMQLHQLQPLPTKKAEFNQGVVQKLVNGMSFMDNQVQKIRNGERYQKKTAQEIKAINDKRKEIAQTKLSANFPKKIIIDQNIQENLSESDEEAELSKKFLMNNYCFFGEQEGATQKKRKEEENNKSYNSKDKQGSKPKAQSLQISDQQNGLTQANQIHNNSMLNNSLDLQSSKKIIKRDKNNSSIISSLTSNNEKSIQYEDNCDCDCKFECFVF